MSMFDQLGNAQRMMPQRMPNNMNVLQRLQQFRQTFSGNPQQQVQQMLNSGQITKQQYDNAVQMANQIQRMLGGR